MAKPVAKSVKRENRKRKKNQIRSAVKKFRKTDDSKVKVSSDYTGPRVEQDFSGWLQASKVYWRKLRKD